MNSLFNLALRNFIFHRRSHGLTLVGAAIGCAVLVGALSVGDSLQYSLRRIALDRLGQTDLALSSGDRLFRTVLADSLQSRLSQSVAPALSLGGVALSADGNHRVGKITILGVDDRFFRMAPEPFVPAALLPGEAYINTYLAQRLDLKKGDEAIVRVKKPALWPAELPLARESNATIAIRFRVKDIISDDRFGRFSLTASQREPYNIYFSMANLNEEMGLSGRSNVLLVSNGSDLARVQSALDKAWQPEDIGLLWRNLPQLSQREYLSSRIFLESQIIEAAGAATPVFTYFINRFVAGPNTTPYSFISTANVLDPQLSLADHEILINQWLADDLHMQTGDSLRLYYYVIGTNSQLFEQSSGFQVRTILPMSGANLDSTLMPELPGLADVENCRDWHPGMPVDLKKIRNKDEAYWKKYHGAPKAFVSLATAQRLWSNRFGQLTALRFPASISAGQVERRIKSRLKPVQFGLALQPVRQQALISATPMTDFSQLFIGLSFFVILSALLLTGLLFQLALEERTKEIGVYVGLGFTASQIRRLFLMEGAIVAAIAMVIGPILGLGYQSLLLIGIANWWSAAFAIPAVHLHVRGITLFSGAAISTFLSLLVIFRQVKRFTVRSPHSLQQGNIMPERHGRGWLYAGLMLLLSGLLLLILTSSTTSESATRFFFSAGFLWLTGSLCLCRYALIRFNRPQSKPVASFHHLALRNATRHSSRSIAVVILLGVGVFLVTAIGLNRLAVPETGDRTSGTGGFDLWMETSSPLIDDLNSSTGRRTYGLVDSIWNQVRFFNLRLLEGDDASCLNLNRSRQTHLLGIDATAFAERDAFTFVQKAVGITNPWQALASGDHNVLAGIADQTVIQWGLGKAVGDTLIYKDEAGATYKIRLIAGLANSVFQGHILISTDVLLQHYPSQAGYRVFLIDAPAFSLAKVQTNLKDLLSDYGAETIITGHRLTMFNKVTNTYLSIFMMLGGLALLIGSVGVGIVVSRNIFEQRAELAVMSAIGFTSADLVGLMQLEHRWLFLAGLAIGITSAMLAVLPTVRHQGFNAFVVMIVLVLVLSSGLFWIRYAVKKSIGKKLTATLTRDK